MKNKIVSFIVAGAVALGSVSYAQAMDFNKLRHAQSIQPINCEVVQQADLNTLYKNHKLPFFQPLSEAQIQNMSNEIIHYFTKGHEQDYKKNGKYTKLENIYTKFYHLKTQRLVNKNNDNARVWDNACEKTMKAEKTFLKEKSLLQKVDIAEIDFHTSQLFRGAMKIIDEAQETNNLELLKNFDYNNPLCAKLIDQEYQDIYQKFVEEDPEVYNSMSM